MFIKYYPAYANGSMNVTELARICGLSRPTAYNSMNKRLKKTIIILLLVILHIDTSFSCSMGKAEADANEFAIVVSANASSTEMYAAETLQEYLNILNNSYYEIITDDKPFHGFKFCIGATSVYDTSDDIKDKAADSYVLAPFDNGLAIFGVGGRGTLYGVHTFL